MPQSLVKLSIALFVMSAGFFAIDVLIDMSEHLNAGRGYAPDEILHLVFEVIAVFSLLLGAYLVWAHVRYLNKKNEQDARTIQAFRNNFEDIVQKQFASWGLTEAERDVAHFTLRGLSLGEIAELRGTSVGTTKAQTNAIFNKSGVKSRTDFLGFFLDEFLDAQEH